MTDNERIEELRQRLKGNLSKVDRMTVLEAKNALKNLLYGQLKKTRDKNDPEKCKEMDDLALEIIQEGTKLIRKESLVNVQKLYEMIKECYQFRGRRYFKDFLIATEWNFDSDMKLYQIRRIVFDEWAEYLEDLEYGRLRGLSISAPPRTGKALSMDSGILTPNGWKLMKDVHEGDYVIASDGKPAEVLGVFPQGIKDMYRVTFDDKTSVKCSGDHMWTVQTNADRQKYKGKIKNRVLKTTDMLEDIRLKAGDYKYSIDYIKPVEFNNTLKEDDLHPYIVGIMLSNGCINDNVLGVYTPYIDILEKIEKNMPNTDKLNIKKYDNVYKCSIGKKIKGHQKNSTMIKFIEYGLINCTAKNKFIPKKYLYSSIENRIELLRGLMDGDGSSSCKQTRYTTVSKKLAEDIIELVRSLGGRVTCNKHESYKNNKRNLDRYDLQITMDINPFYCNYKASQFIERKKRKVKKIVSIEKIPDEECQCIYVDHPDHLFVTDGYNLTHNTAIGTMFFMWCMLRHSDRSCFFCSHTRSDGKKSLL